MRIANRQRQKSSPTWFKTLLTKGSKATKLDSLKITVSEQVLSEKTATLEVVIPKSIPIGGAIFASRILGRILNLNFGDNAVVCCL
jgi:hypothetical protein